MVDEGKKAVAQELVKSSGGKELKGWLQSDQFKTAIRSGLPKHLTVDRFIRVVLNALLRQPELLQCSQESLFLAFLNLSSYGIEPDGRRAHLIPYWNNKVCKNCNHAEHEKKACKTCDCQRSQSRRDAQLIIDYKGLAELVRRSGEVSYIHADVVYKGDEWTYCYGSGAHLKHTPAEQPSDVRVAYYSYVKLKDGNEDFIVMSPREVEKIRARSKAANNGPWVTDFDEMGKKTVFRRHSKWLPLSPEIKDALEADDDAVDVDFTQALEAASERAEAATEGVLAAKMAALNGADEADTSEKAVDGEEAEKRGARKVAVIDGISVYDSFPRDPSLLKHGERLYVQREGKERLYQFDADMEREGGGKGDYLPVEEQKSEPREKAAATGRTIRMER